MGSAQLLSSGGHRRRNCSGVTTSAKGSAKCSSSRKNTGKSSPARQPKLESPKCPKKHLNLGTTEVDSKAPSNCNDVNNLRSPLKKEQVDVKKSHDGLSKKRSIDFTDYTQLTNRLAKSLYYTKKMPSTPRPSFPLTVLAVNAFTSSALGVKLDTLEFLDLELASEIGMNACVSPTALIMTLVYLERLYSHNPSYLSSVKPSELFVISLLVASKFMQDDGEDSGIYNDEWASSARMETKDINQLEIEFLCAIDWNVNVSHLEFEKVLQNLELELAKQEGGKRDWLTYSELNILSSAFLTWNTVWPMVYEYMVKVIVAASITYATLVTTLLTSSIFVPQLVNLLSKSILTAPSIPSQLQQLTPLNQDFHNSQTNLNMDYWTPTEQTTFDLAQLAQDLTTSHVELDNDNSSTSAFNNVSLTSGFESLLRYQWKNDHLGKSNYLLRHDGLEKSWQNLQWISLLDELKPDPDINGKYGKKMVLFEEHQSFQKVMAEHNDKLCNNFLILTGNEKRDLRDTFRYEYQLPTEFLLYSKL